VKSPFIPLSKSKTESFWLNAIIPSSPTSSDYWFCYNFWFVFINIDDTICACINKISILDSNETMFSIYYY
jgi:hypothetical protein